VVKGVRLDKIVNDRIILGYATDVLAAEKLLYQLCADVPLLVYLFRRSEYICSTENVENDTFFRLGSLINHDFECMLINGSTNCTSPVFSSFLNNLKDELLKFAHHLFAETSALR